MLLSLLGLFSSSGLIEVLPAPGEYTSIQTLSFTVSDNSTIKFTLNGGVEQIYTVPITMSENTVVEYWGVDQGGNIGEKTTLTYIIDAIAPTTTINHPAGLYNSILEVILISDETSIIRYKIGNGAYQIYTAPFLLSTDAIISYYATDTIGNIESVKTTSYTFDLVSPVTTIKPNPGFYKTVQNITLSSNELGSAIYYTLNGGIEQVYSTPFTILTDSIIEYYSIDSAGNREVTKAASYVIDNIAPITSISPLPGLYSGIQNITLTPNESSVVQYSVNNGPWQVYSIPFMLAEDSEVRYRGIDISGNIEAIKTVNYLITDVTVYRINGGPWIPYTGPFNGHHYEKIEAAVRYTGGAFSDINEVSYTIIDTTDQWIMVG